MILLEALAYIVLLLLVGVGLSWLDNQAWRWPWLDLRTWRRK